MMGILYTIDEVLLLLVIGGFLGLYVLMPLLTAGHTWRDRLSR
ncbi:hypothetical protein [Halomontanus rarus]